MADFPISVLQRQPPLDASGRKIDQIVYESTTYDPVGRRRVPQRVTLTTSSRHGLPTPADENVVLALLYTAKRAHDFREPRVHFSPHQLFRVMRRDPNSRSYERLGRVLLRLKSLTILYENAWWDPSGRRYREELATGIIAEYRLVKTKVRRKVDVEPPSYVHWTPNFFKSLASGNLKKLDLDRLFALELPTAQRMYRFLDKRFYSSPEWEIDLREFACGHLGVTASPNVAELKAAARPGDRRARVRRVPRAGATRRSASSSSAKGSGASASAARGRPQSRPRPVPTPRCPLLRRPRPPSTPWSRRSTALGARGDAHADAGRAGPGPRLGRAVRRRGCPRTGPVGDRALRRKFPSAQRFGAAIPYFDEADREHRRAESRRALEASEARRRQVERARDDRHQADDDAFLDAWRPAWEALDEPGREAIRAAVLRDHPYLGRPLLRASTVATRFYLEELARRRNAGRDPDPDPV